MVFISRIKFEDLNILDSTKNIFAERKEEVKKFVDSKQKANSYIIPGWIQTPVTLPFKYKNNVKDFAQAFIDAFHHKCAFCEVIVDKSKFLENPKILYYRHVDEQAEYYQVGDANYYWLSWEWSNMFLACDDCHTAKKNRSDVFPISNSRALPGIFDVQILNEIESPLLLNPCIENPATDILFTLKDGVPLANGETERGTSTIHYFNLNRDDLIEKRIDSWQRFKIILEGALQQGNGWKDVWDQTKDDAEFAGMKRSLSRNVLEENRERIISDPIGKEIITNVENVWFKDISSKIILPAQSTDPNSFIKIDRSINLSSELGEKEKRIIKNLFEDVYTEVTIEQELKGGFSNSKIFVVRPTKSPLRFELPVVVKLGTYQIITKEITGFEKYIRNRFKFKADIERKFLDESLRAGGIVYPLIDDEDEEGGFKTQNLKMYLLDKANNDKDSEYVINRLFRMMRRLWDEGKKHYQYQWRDGFDSILPVNLYIDIDEKPTGSETISTYNTLRDLSNGKHKVGDFLSFGIGMVEDVENTKNGMYEVTLNIPPVLQQPKDDLLSQPKYRIRLLTQKPNKFHADMPNIKVTGKLLRTRVSFLEDQLRKSFELSHETPLPETLDFSATLSLPNPLIQLDTTLDQPRPSKGIKTAPIHGDFYTENILIQSDGVSKNVYLIDFGETREDYVLHDFWRLECAFWNYIIPSLLPSRNPYDIARSIFMDLLSYEENPSEVIRKKKLKTIYNLLLALRKEARRHFSYENDNTEYLRGLFIYCLSSLKFGALDQYKSVSPKKLAIFIATEAYRVFGKKSDRY